MEFVKNSRWIDLLEDEDLAFIKRFILVSGSLKDLAEAYHVTYPTLRLRLDRLIAKIEIFDSQKIEDDYERILRASFAEGKLDTATFKQLLSAYNQQKERFNMKSILGLIAVLAFTVTAWSQTSATDRPTPVNSANAVATNRFAGKEWFFGNTQHPWWSNGSAGWVGGVGGSLLGCLGALVGVLNGMGKGRRFVIGLMKIEVVLGVVFLGAGVVAFVQHQPYAVWYPLLLGGFLMAVIPAALLRGVEKAYRDRELRRMQSLDAAGR